MSIARYVSPSEWERFDRLPNRVQCLAYDYDEISSPLLHPLASRNNPSPLFPNLHLLIWRSSTGDTAKQRFIRSPCISSNLSVFTIQHSGKHGYGRVDQDLPVVCAACPGLPHIRADYALRDDAEQVLTIFRNLRSARLDAIGGDAVFRHLATLPHFKEELHGTWSNHRNSSDPASVANAPFATGGFLALQRLKMSGMDGRATVLRVLLAVSSVSLSLFSVFFLDKLSLDTLRCVEELASLPALVSLRRFNIDIHFDIKLFRDGDRTERMTSMFSAFLRPLSHLRTLEDIAFDVHLRAWSISDEDIETMIKTRPHLIRLSIHDDTSESLQSLWQPHGVLIVRPSLIADCRRKLRTLGVEIADVSEDELVRLEARITRTTPQLSPQTALQDLTFAGYDYRERIMLPDIGRHARALHALFPRLGGLGDPIENPVVGIEEQLMYYGWSQDDMRNLEISGLPETLERLKSTPSILSRRTFVSREQTELRPSGALHRVWSPMSNKVVQC